MRGGKKWLRKKTRKKRKEQQEEIRIQREIKNVK
jgi:hypothetical protein